VSMDKAPVTDTLVRQLFELASTPFLLRAFRDRCEKFGWSYRPEDGDEFGFRLRVSDGLSMSIEPLGDQVISATLPFYYWEDYEPQFHQSPKEYERQREAYQAKFQATTELAQQILPPPVLRWRDADKDAHLAIGWAGEHGLLLLQQAAFDLQFGMELNFWLMGGTIEEFKPETPLIDWLCERSRESHDKRGFPRLQW
jgi:hypothetical protein